MKNKNGTERGRRKRGGRVGGHVSTVGIISIFLKLYLWKNLLYIKYNKKRANCRTGCLLWSGKVGWVSEHRFLFIKTYFVDIKDYYLYYFYNNKKVFLALFLNRKETCVDLVFIVVPTTRNILTITTTAVAAATRFTLLGILNFLFLFICVTLDINPGIIPVYASIISSLDQWNFQLFSLISNSLLPICLHHIQR